MIEQEKHINEIYEFKHRHDKLLHTGSNYEEKLLSRIMSSVMFGNPITASFLKEIQKNVIYMIESNLIVRNMFNYTVSKYYNKHNN